MVNAAIWSTHCSIDQVSVLHGEKREAGITTYIRAEFKATYLQCLL